MRSSVCAAAFLTAAVFATGGAAAQPAERSGQYLDLTHTVVVALGDLTPREQRAVDLLVDEVEKRTGVRWPVGTERPSGVPSVAIVPSSAAFAGAADDMPGPEGYVLQSDVRGVAVIGADERGLLYGVGRLLRELRMGKGSAQIPLGLTINTAPKHPLRGHQLGYRPKTNSYDAWTAEMWEQYIRDLAVFGINAIELIPPRSDDAPDSPHFPEPQIVMMRKMSQIADDYGIDVWIWYPALDPDYSKPEQVEFAMKEWGEVFAQLPRINAVLVPGGDPGHTPPQYMMPLLEKQTQVLQGTHPEAKMWMSPQGFGREWLDWFINYLQTEQPEWLGGVVFAPQNFISQPELRKLVPERYPIRRYDDITHTVKCQFPVPDWDYVYAITEQREPINPRPRDYANIFRLWDEYAIGFVTYSEGCNDDVNKAVWSGLGWDPEQDVFDILREYARYYIGPEYEYSFAQGLLDLEENWRGPILTNGNVETTLERFRQMEREASPQVKLNWRFQQALYRAYYDAYNRRRALYEYELQEQAMDALRQASVTTADAALAEAERILKKAVTEPVGQDLRARVFELAEALYQSVRMQLSVPRYQAIDVGRGANLDLIDVPLNDRLWLTARFAEIRQLPSESERIDAIQALVNWTNPGPGGFYDDLGNLTRQPHLVRDPQEPENERPWVYDPEFRRASLVGFQYDLERRVSWITHAESRYDAPLVMQYDTLDPSVDYIVRVVYAGDAFGTPERPIRVRLEADDGISIHDFMPKPRPLKPLEFDVPRKATADGKLTLRFYQEPGRGGNGRGCQVGEVWLLPKTPQE
jgi:hypothetical protein